MKTYLKLAAVVALFFTLSSIPVRSVRAEEKWERPGAKEQAAVDNANKVLDGVYRDLMAKADDPKVKTSLRDAQRAWIKWRDAEANYIARRVAIGGSALRVAYAEAELKLIEERTAVLKAYASQPPPE